jgi:AAA family ATP:ADP antiporter
LSARKDPPDGTTDLDRKTALEVVLGVFADVRAGEGVTALLLALNVFLLLTTYYIIKPVREALILVGGGAELKSYTSAWQAALLLLLVPLYGTLASRLPRKRLIQIVTLFFAACLVGFRFAAASDVPNLGVAFFLWVGIFNLMVIAQFWAFANDLYTPEQGKRLFAIVAFGASFGAVSGSWIAGRIIGPVGVENMLLVAAALLVTTLGLVQLVERRWHRERKLRLPAQPGGPGPPAEDDENIGGEESGFRLVLRDRYLTAIAALLLLLNWVNTTGEYILGRVVSRTALALVNAGQAGGLSEGQWIGKFYADFFTVVNTVGLIAQLFVVSRILKYLGVRVALLILPVIAFGGYAMLAFVPILSVVRWVKTAENATDYSLNNTVRQVLFLPLSREEKYKAKQAIDSFFVRLGDALSALLVYLGTAWLAFDTQDFALVNLGLVTAWIVVAWWIGRENERRVAFRPADATGSAGP